MAILISLLVLSILVFVHELGHFLAAKRAGIKVEEFGLGYPPRLLGVNRRETTYSINLIPFGGFVKIDEEELADYPKRTRVMVISSGILMNLALAIISFSLIFGILGIPRKQGFVEIKEVAPGSPAEAAGIQAESLLRNFTTNQEFVAFIGEHLGQEIELELERAGERLVVKVTPRKEPAPDQGPLGVVISDSQTIQPAWWQRPFLAAWFGLKETFSWLLMIIFGVGQMFYRLLFRGAIPQDVAGPIGIVQVTADVARHGWLALLQFLGLLSINLAVLNFLPLPALDGGRLVFILVEALTGKKPQPKFERIIHTIGMAILLLLMTAVTIQDIKRLLAPGVF